MLFDYKNEINHLNRIQKNKGKEKFGKINLGTVGEKKFIGP